VCTDFETTDSGQFLQFETLTLCPIDIRPINAGMLWSDEREWLNNYHQKVFALLSPYLKPVLLDWLKDRTQPI
ncbi:MAG: M24 family metallopeptidase C-terminal domain-containing protein, partial [Bacteroidales bacterium]